MLEIALRWDSPRQLERDRSGYFWAADELPDLPGIYVFARQRGAIVQPIYIGLATSLRKRVGQHLRNAKLLEGLQRARGGKRVLMIATLERDHGVDTRELLRAVERSMIHHAIAEGYEILNKHGRPRPAYLLRHRGSRSSRTWLPKKIEAERLKPRKRTQNTLLGVS